MENLIVALVILLILSISILKLVREKRKGAKCVGCPLSGSNSGCSGHCS